MTNILTQRLRNQQLYLPEFTDPQEVVAHMGAIQAQDYGAAKWALGQRVKGATNESIEAAFTSGDIIRTHVLRPTWHFVAPADIRWMLQLTAPRVIAQCAHACRTLGLDAATFKHSHKALEQCLQGNKQLTRAEIEVALQHAKVNTRDLRFTHLMMRAELDGLICSGGRQGKQFTYALLEERVPPAEKRTDQEALAILTTKYFTSHAPATLHDFAWWSGLTLTMAKQGMEMVKEQFINEKTGGNTYWLPNSGFNVKDKSGTVYLLPNYDEYIVAYKDRSMLMNEQHNNKLDSRGNVLFQNVIVLNGRVVGIWKRTVKANDVIVETTPFEPLSKTQQIAIATAIKAYKKFML